MTVAGCAIQEIPLMPFIPAVKRGGNKRAVDIREVVNGFTSVLSTRCQWRALLKHLPARSTVNRNFLW